MKIGKSKSLIGLAVVLALLVGMTYLFLQVSGAQQPETERVVTTAAQAPEQPEKPPPPEHQLPSPVATASEIDWETSKTVPFHRIYNFTPTASPKALLTEDFEEGIMPPTNWSVVVTNPYTWEIDSYDPYEGYYNASCFYDPDLVPQDEWLISPVINLTSKGEEWHLYFFWMMSYYWAVDPYDNYELEVWIDTDGDDTFDNMLWCEDDVGVFSSWTWYMADVDLAGYLTYTNAKLGWRYVGSDGAQASLDFINVDAELIGRCCYGDPQNPDCADITEDSCNVLGGTWDYGLNCTDNPCEPRPPNDDCEDAIQIYPPDCPSVQTVSGTTIGATIDCPDVLGWDAVWYKFELTYECNDVYIDYCPTNSPDVYTRGVVLYNECPPDCPNYILRTGLEWVTCPSTYTDLTVWWYNLPAGMYWLPVYVHDWDDNPMDFVFDICVEECEPLGPGNDCGDPIVVDLNKGPGDTLYLDQNQTTCGRVNDYDMTCLGSYDGGEDIIYQVNVSSAVDVDIKVDAKGTSWIGVAIDVDCPPGDPCMAFSTGSGTVQIIPGVHLDPGTYYIMVDTWPSPDCIPDFDLVITEAVVLENDDCADATPVGEVTDLAFSTTAASFDGQGSCMTSPNIWYLFTSPCTQDVTVSLCGSDYDTKLAVYDGSSCDPLSPEIECNDDFCGLQSQITFPAVEGNEYLIEVGGYSTNTGDGVLNIYCVEACSVVCPPGGYDEGEGYCYDDYDDTYNVGCNGVPPDFIFQEIACGDTICGSCGVYDFFGATYRDMDWFAVSCSEGDLTLTCVAEFPLALWLFDQGFEDCVDLVNLDFINTTQVCDTLSVSAYVTAGTYLLIIAPMDWGDYPCGPTSEYVAWVECPSGPQIAVDPAAFDLVLNPDGDCSTADEDLFISNIGAGDLIYDVAEDPEVDWVEVAPTSGTVPGAETDTLEVSFDAGGMAEGDYYTDLVITSNSEGKHEVIVPVHLKVELAPEFEAPPRVWMPVIPGCEMDEVFTVENLGVGELRFEVSVQGSPPPLGAPQGRNQERMFNLVPNRKAEDLFKSGASPSGTGNLSTFAPSDASKVSIQRSPGAPKSLPDDIIWDNGWDAGYAVSSQLDVAYPFVSQVADDFILDGSMNITDVHWWGGFWNGPPDEVDPCDFYIYIYADDGTGNAPTGAGLPDPAPTALATYFFSQISGYPLSPNGNHEYDVVLDPPFPADGGVKYWIAIQAVHAFPPQWGWISSSTIQLHTAVQGFPLLGMAFWTDLAYDMAFYLTGAAGCPFTVTPEADTVEGGGYSNLILTFDGTLFTECVDETLTCYLVFTTNDCDEPVVSVPVHAWSARGDVCGDCKGAGDCVINIGDVICLLNYVFGIGPAPDPMCMGDLDRDGDVDSDDALYLIEYLFLGGPPPEIPTVPAKQTMPIQQK